MCPKFHAFVILTFATSSTALLCYQCTEETCDKKDMRGKCSGALCYKTVVSSPEGLSMIKGCIKTAPVSKLSGCYTEDIKLTTGVYKGQKCYCKYDDFCNSAQKTTLAFLLLPFLIYWIVNFFKMLQI